jgi:predicted GH43/DUF377 family glycosyl hydrolase
MKWRKLGLVYKSQKNSQWNDNSALTPTAILLNRDVIRVYAGFRDPEGVSRIGYVDVDSKDPTRVIKTSNSPVLNIGENGMFDDNGVILGDVIDINGEIRMYYVGFQLVKGVKFLAYTGLAISSDLGETFTRVKNTPILDRADEALFIRAIHSVRFEDGVFKVWYAAGNGWEEIGGVKYPQYDINYVESADGITFPESGEKCMLNDPSNLEYRIGRPRVFKTSCNYLMNFTYGTTDGRYKAGQATSLDGRTWIRDDTNLGIDLSLNGWDSLHLSYPSLVKSSNGEIYMFYNGNNMGADGFGVAQLVGGVMC